jgi:chemotaxis protein histidine kinase CheA
LLFRIAAEKEKLALEHHNALQAQRNNAVELKDQMVQAGLQHAQALKEAIAAGEAKVEEARKELADATGQLRKELEERAKQLKEG